MPKQRFKSQIKSYLGKLQEKINQGDAREESFYSDLDGLLYAFAEIADKKKIQITTLPRKTEAGNPDFRIWDGYSEITGYIEAKYPGTNLDHVRDSDQLKRYIGTFPNLILTDFYEFMLFRDGKEIERTIVSRASNALNLKVAPPSEKEEKFYDLLEKFFAFSYPKAFSAKSLARELAIRTGWLRQVVAEELEKNEKNILGFYDSFQQYLIGGIKKDQFADLYSQTITYGLFTARLQAKNEFTRQSAFDQIPRSLGILRDIFRYISTAELSEGMKWPIDDMVAILRNADPNKIIIEFYQPPSHPLPFHQKDLDKILEPEKKIKDPIFHFYETFLAEYDPRERERRGVYYTPEPVVSYIVRSLNIILKEHFNRNEGLADRSVTVLDPAAGTLSFIVASARTAIEEFKEKVGTGGIKEFIRDHILKNFYAFELMMAPYAVGHLKIGFLLEEYRYKLKEKENERFKFYLTNTLEFEELEESKFPLMRSLSEENHLAGEVKKQTPILVILGNPPYSGISANKGDWITERIEDYKYVDGEHFGEKKHWLQDDYVKFIRFAQWKLDQLDEGVLGFITNHAYLDNPTFRGMRQSLMKSFDKIYILNLHGNTLKKETCPDGKKDENVFDIRQGVAITLFIKEKSKARKKPKIYYTDLWGIRENKYKKLLQNDLKSIRWKKLRPSSPYYFFIPRKEEYLDIYEKWPKITTILKINVTGIVTARDHFVIDFDKAPLKARIMTFMNKNLSDGEIEKGLGLKENYMWRVSKARKELMAVDNWQENFSKILYRPFDIRHIYYHDSVVWRTRKKVMHHMMGENLGLILSRQADKSRNLPVYVSENIVDAHCITGAVSISYFFPLYLYPSSGFEFEEKRRKPNLSPEIMNQLKSSFGKKPSPEEVFYYIYGLLYAPAYREKYAEFLKIDFPRIPFTSDYRVFKKIARLGKDLVELHLMKSRSLDKPIARFQGEGNNLVDKVIYDEKKSHLYVNPDQYFEKIENEVWSYQIGGYQVLKQWLKYRKGRKLNLEDITHFIKTATALKKTIEIQKDIDKIYPEVEKI